jgi:hypothetical protein
VLIGRYWIPFWFYFVAAGLVPLLVMALPRLRTGRGVVVASGLVVFAMWVKRLVIVIPPATEPLVRSPLAAGGVLAGDWGTYHFTWVPISITVAAAAAIPLALLLLFRFVPILPIAEMEELGAEEPARTATAPAPAGQGTGPLPAMPPTRPLSGVGSGPSQTLDGASLFQDTPFGLGDATGKGGPR